MGGCTLIVTLSMCITFSIRRKTWLTLHCSIKQLCIRVQSLLICSGFFFLFLFFLPPKFEAFIFKQVVLCKRCVFSCLFYCHSFIQLQVRDPNTSQSCWLGMFLLSQPKCKFLPKQSHYRKQKQHSCETDTVCITVFISYSLYFGSYYLCTATHQGL